MHVYYQTAPVAEVKSMFDGHQYLDVTTEMGRLPGGQYGARNSAQSKPRMMRVSHVENGMAFAQLGKAGDAIACLENLPAGVVTKHEVDQPQLAVK